MVKSSVAIDWSVVETVGSEGGLRMSTALWSTAAHDISKARSKTIVTVKLYQSNKYLLSCDMHGGVVAKMSSRPHCRTSSFKPLVMLIGVMV